MIVTRTKKISLVLFFIISFLYCNSKSNYVYKQVRKNQSLINDVYRHLITNYVDEIDLDAFTKKSIT